MKRLLTAVATIALLAACDRSDPPVEKIERAAEELVTEADPAPAPQEPQGPFAPRDECAGQPGASAFIAELRAAADARDADALAALSAEDIQLDFGGGAGRALLKERLGDPQYDLWGELEEVLAMGCASDGAVLSMPWYWTQPYTVDPFEGAIVTGENVAVHAAPDGASPRVGVLSWNEVTRTAAYDPEAEWAAIRWDDPEADEDKSGFIRQSKLRSIVDYRIEAALRNDRWRLTSFIAGD